MTIKKSNQVLTATFDRSDVYQQKVKCLMKTILVVLYLHSKV